MNSIHNNGGSDKSLNDGLDELGHAYGQLDQDEPPQLLDQAILNSAHRAVEKKPHWMKIGWLQGLTTAAVFVLAFSLILNQREPAPVFESDTRSAEPVSLQSEKRATEPPTVGYAQDSLQAKSEPVDQDKEAGELMLEEALLDETDFMSNAPVLDKASRQAAPAGARARKHSQTEAEQELLAIIKLKQTGNPSWETALKSFMENYPDYPLPQELKVP
jgi:hypothetical protein